jgi:hypothetical protein
MGQQHTRSFFICQLIWQWNVRATPSYNRPVVEIYFPSNQRSALDVSKQNWLTVTCLPGALLVALFYQWITWLFFPPLVWCNVPDRYKLSTPPFNFWTSNEEMKMTVHFPAELGLAASHSAGARIRIYKISECGICSGVVFLLEIKSDPTTRHGGAWGERRYSSYSFLT